MLIKAKTPPPKWAFDAWDMHYNKGIRRQDIADHFGKHLSRVGQVFKQIKEEGWMPDRKFEPIRNYKCSQTGTLMNGVMLRCGVAGCKNTIKHLKAHGTCNPQHSAQYFRNKGWIVGAGPRADRCSEHAGNIRATKSETKMPETAMSAALEKAKQKPAEQIKEGLKEALSVAKGETKPHAVHGTVHKETKVIADPDPTREERRIIFAKLNEVYLDEDTGYSKDWSDQKVAHDLGVRKSWVAKIRDENFGPDINSQQLAALVKDIRDRADDLAAVGRGIQKLKDEVNEKYAFFEKLQKELEAKISDLTQKS